MCIAPLNVSMCLCCWQSEICVSISVRQINWNSSYLYQPRRTKYNLHDQLPPPINYNKLPRKSIYVSLQSTLLYVRVGVTLSSVLFVGDCLSSVRVSTGTVSNFETFPFTRSKKLSRRAK